MSKIVGIIPARYASTRFPGKPLIDIDGKSMVQRVYEQASKSKSLNQIVVATDDERIFNHIKNFSGKVVMTSTDCASGTDRCYDAIQQLDADIDYVINIQGDEPFIAPEQIDELATALTGNGIELATQMIKVNSYESLFDKGEVKIVLNSNDEAMYFSRMVIPFIKGVPETEWHLHHNYYRHVGMYAYRKDILEKITALPVSSLEKAESLEQLRWIENRFIIKCILTAYESHCIDTPDDLQKARQILNDIQH
jgi:3-deoxy-manno-octulosonate cytidylyltransferase (CMP-KDO synthetase)